MGKAFESLINVQTPNTFRSSFKAEYGRLLLATAWVPAPGSSLDSISSLKLWFRLQLGFQLQALALVQAPNRCLHLEIIYPAGFINYIYPII